MLTDICKIPAIETLLNNDVKELIHFFKRKEKPRVISKNIAKDSGVKIRGSKIPVPTRWQSQRAFPHSVLRLKYPLEMAVAHKKVEKTIPLSIKINIVDSADHFEKNIEHIYNLIAAVSFLIKNIEGDAPNLSYFPIKLRRLFKFLKKGENIKFLDYLDEDLLKDILVDRLTFMYHPV